MVGKMEGRELSVSIEHAWNQVSSRFLRSCICNDRTHSLTTAILIWTPEVLIFRWGMYSDAPPPESGREKGIKTDQS